MGDELQSVERAFRLLNLVAGRPAEPYTVSELAQAVGCGVSTVSRLTRTLAKLGILESAGRKTGYVLGAAIAGLGKNYADRNPLRQAAREPLRELHTRFGEYCCVSQLLDFSRYLSAVEDVGSAASHSSNCLENPYRSVSGRMLLAALPRRERERFRRHCGAPGALWPAAAEPGGYAAELDRIAALELLQEPYGDAQALAFPLKKNGETCGALGVLIPDCRALRGGYLAELIDFAHTRTIPQIVGSPLL